MEKGSAPGPSDAPAGGAAGPSDPSNDVAAGGEGAVEEDSYTGERIIKAKMKGRKKVYLVKWEGYSEDEDNTWEPGDNLHPDLLADFEKEQGESTEGLVARSQFTVEGVAESYD